MAGNDYHIYIHKQQREGTSVLSPESPAPGSSSATSANQGFLTLKGAVLLSYSKMIASKVISTTIQEMRANGNEQQATQLSNIVSGSTALISILATKGLALIPMALDASVTAFTNVQTINRENTERAYALREQGTRVTFNQGRVYG